ncbi:MAG: hypothetical protein PUD21_08980 [Clostridiaceae bacterium]|nr:hypothetical protein [Clostridiaceae bacterium]
MDNMIRIDKDYIEWLKHVKNRFKNTQIKASIKVNYELSNFLPENLATLLPSTDELKSRLLLDNAVNDK